MAVSNNFTEVKLFVEKIGTNRRLFEKTVSWDWQKPFCLLAGAGQGERSEQGAESKNLQNTNWLRGVEGVRNWIRVNQANYWVADLAPAR